ncbi:unnamed protein product [Malus baccata var. baccata]
MQTLEDILRSSVLQFGDAWHKRLSLIEFAYNNSFHYSITMAPFEALYGKPCRTPLCWSEVGEQVLVGPEIVDETTQNIQVIKANLKAAQDRQKSITDRHSTNRVYKVLRFGKKGKLSPRYIGPYQIVERVGEVAYRLALPPELVRVHNVFHVSMLRRNKTMQMVKVLWMNHSVKEPTWEIEERMRDMYPHLFYCFDL